MPVRFCSVCQEEIPAKRLKAAPNAISCVACLTSSGDVVRHAVAADKHISDRRSIDVRTTEDTIHDATAVASTGDFSDFEEEDIPAHELAQTTTICMTLMP